MPTAAVRRAIAALERYFAGERVDFSAGVELDLEGVGSFHRKIYAAARDLGWGADGELRRSRARHRSALPCCARRRSGHGSRPRADHRPLSSRIGRRSQDRRLFRAPGGTQTNRGCSCSRVSSLTSAPRCCRDCWRRDGDLMPAAEPVRWRSVPRRHPIPRRTLRMNTVVLPETIIPLRYS